MISKQQRLDAIRWRAMQARETGYTPPPVPRHLRDIEDSCDAQLFAAWARARQGRTLQPTSIEPQPSWSR